MIDYNKLRTAHKLTQNLPFLSYSFDCWCCTGIESGFFYTLKYEDNEDMIHEYESENIDELIEKLEKLTQPQLRYKIGDEVWYLDLPINKIFSGKILKVRDTEYYINGRMNGTKEEFLEDELYPTKQALIESQVQYWMSQLDTKCVLSPDINQCQHERDNK